MIHLATIQSIVQVKLEGDTIDAGVYELEVWVSLRAARASGDPKGYCNHQMATHLAGCVKDTGLPLHEQLWNVEFTQWAQTHMGYPKGFTP